MQSQNFVNFVNYGLKFESGNNIKFREKRDIEDFAHCANLAYFKNLTTYDYITNLLVTRSQNHLGGKLNSLSYLVIYVSIIQFYSCLHGQKHAMTNDAICNLGQILLKL